MLIRPTPYPDEMDRGYFGRLLRLNGLPTSDLRTGILRVRSMESAFWPVPGIIVPTVDVMARSAGMDVNHFIVCHTLLPWRQISARRLPTNSWGHVFTRATLQMLLRPGAALCRSCSEEDIAFHGMSYWRRSHQLPGSVICDKHGQRLVRLADERAFLEPPSCFGGKPVCEADGNDRPVVSRFNQLLWELGSSGLSINESVLGARLRRLATERGYIRPRWQLAKGRLFPEIEKACGRAWLLEVAPALVRSQASAESTFSTSTTFYRLPTTLCYLLLTAYLSENDDEAWEMLMGQPAATRLMH